MKTQPLKILFFFSLLVALLSSCSQEDEVTYQLNSKLVELKCGNTFALEVSPTLSALTYNSLNTNIATVTSSGVVKAGLVGTTKVVVKDEKASFVDTVSVAVTSIHTYYQDPFLRFGANQKTVEDNVPYYLNAVNDEAVNSFFLNYYLGESSFVKLWFYYFTINGVYIYVGARFNDIYTEDVVAHIDDRYAYMVTKKYIWDDEWAKTAKFYINPDSTLLVLSYDSGGQFNCDYFPANKAVIDQVLTSDTVVFKP